MSTKNVIFSNPGDVIDFVKIVEKYPFDMDMKRGRYIVDAKSLLGLMNLGFDQKIELKVEDYKCTFGRAGFLKWPIIRGVVSFVDGLVVGTKCLMYSAEIAGDEEDEKEAAKNATLTEEELSAKKDHRA